MLLINDLTVLRSYRLYPSPDIRYSLVPVTRIAFWQSKGECGAKKMFFP